MNNLDNIKNAALENPNEFVKWLETLGGESVKWKHAANMNQLVLKTDNYYYKIYAFNEVDKFNSVIRHAFAEVYQSYGIKWDIITVKTDKGYLDIERREHLELCKEWSDELFLNYANTLKLVEEKINLERLKDQVKEKYKLVYKIKLLRQCVNKPIDYGIYKNKIILLDDADWFLAMIDINGRQITMHNLFVKVSLNDEDYIFTRSMVNPQRTVTIEKINEASNRFFCFKCLDLITRDIVLRQDFNTMIYNNINLLMSKDDEACINAKESLCTAFKKTYYLTDDKTEIDFDIYNKIAVRHEDIRKNKSLWDISCFYYEGEKICGIHLYSSIYDSIKDLCELLDQAKVMQIDPVEGYLKTGVILHVPWNIVYNDKKWKRNLEYIKQHYQKVSIVVDIVLTEPYLNKILSGELSVKYFTETYGVDVTYGINDDSDKEFWPKRKTMLNFLKDNKYEIHKYMEIYRNEYGFDEELLECGHNKNNFLSYNDSNKCPICDWKVVGNIF